MGVWAPLGLKVCSGQHQNVCVWAPLGLKVCNGQHQNVCVWVPLGLKVCNGQHQNVFVWAPLGLKVCNGQHQNVCIWAPLGHILDLENGAGREEKKKQAMLLFCMGCNKDPICRFPLMMKVCVHACLVVLFLGGVNFLFFFWGLRQNSCSLWLA